ncbi:SMI1/KNR4 family protein [Prevotella intermedia]|uniref:SMI1/KNR4 family protein n=1 Tax=Prevotella intermedia TaxID=28131 RepID=UPI00397E0560
MEIKNILESNGLYEVKILSSCDYISVPKEWYFILKEEDKSLRRDFVLNYWKPFSLLLPKTIKIFEQYLDDVFLISHNEQVKVVYLFSIDNEYVVYVGNPPKTDNMLTIFPEKLREFYMHIHNGWFESISEGLGLLPIEKVQFLDESEWGLTDEILQSVDLSKTYYVFHNGGGGFLCINTEDAENPKSLVWWTNNQPKLNIEFWSFLDSWIEIGFLY